MSRRALLWLVPLFITLHNLEEMIGIPSLLEGLNVQLPAWAARVIPPGGFPPSYHRYLFMLLLVTALPYVLALLPGRKKARGPRTMLLALVQTLMFVNVFSHLALWNLTNRYVPGLITALVFNLPFSIVMLASGLRQGWLRGSDFAYLLPFAILLHGPGLFGLMWLASLVAV